MVAYSLKKRFVVPIAIGLGAQYDVDFIGDRQFDGAKRQTIRAARKRHALPGEEIQLYFGMRTRYCTLLGRPTCTDVAPIALNFALERVTIVGQDSFAGAARLDLFAQWDGFWDWDEMREFWRKEHGKLDHFQGFIVSWSKPTRHPAAIRYRPDRPRRVRGTAQARSLLR